jgi:hypothetical protein
MQRLKHSAAVRLAAVLVAVALGGVVPWLEAPHDEATHRCQCPRGSTHHDCDCPLCAAQAARAARAARAAAEGARVPPCHLAAARKAEAARHEAERKAAARHAAGGPTLSSTCGAGDQRIDPPPLVASFTAPEAPAVAIIVTVSALLDRRFAGLGAPVEPETPPPRLA